MLTYFAMMKNFYIMYPIQTPPVPKGTFGRVIPTNSQVINI